MTSHSYSTMTHVVQYRNILSQLTLVLTCPSSPEGCTTESRWGRKCCLPACPPTPETTTWVGRPSSPGGECTSSVRPHSSCRCCSWRTSLLLDGSSNGVLYEARLQILSSSSEKCMKGVALRGIVPMTKMCAAAPGKDACQVRNWSQSIMSWPRKSHYYEGFFLPRKSHYYEGYFFHTSRQKTSNFAKKYIIMVKRNENIVHVKTYFLLIGRQRWTIDPRGGQPLRRGRHHLLRRLLRRPQLSWRLHQSQPVP